MSLTLADVSAILGSPSGLIASDGMAFAEVGTDTRTLKPGALFVALVSPKNDGHRYLTQALALGASGLVVSEPIHQTDPSVSVPVWQVPDTQIAYGQLGRAWRDRFAIPVIGVTGSVGKTTTKEMLSAALSPLGPILKTEASQNNETGVPKALLQLTSEHKAAVIEMGMRGAGQIAALCEIARPTLGVITRIADNHIELLGSLEAIADAKGELCAALSENDLAVLNADDPMLPRLRAKTMASVVTFGLSDSADFPATECVRTEDGWRFDVLGTSIQIQSPSRHDVANALAAWTVAVSVGVAPEAAAAALEGYVPPPMRMQVLDIPSWQGTILNDSYNAAPASVRSALETLVHYGGGRKIAFLGDMKELGTHSAQAHADLGVVIEALGGLAALYTVGPEAHQIPGAVHRFADSTEAAAFARQSLGLEPGDVVLVKGSRAMAMERIAEALQSRPSGIQTHAH